MDFRQLRSLGAALIRAMPGYGLFGRIGATGSTATFAGALQHWLRRRGGSYRRSNATKVGSTGVGFVLPILPIGFVLPISLGGFGRPISLGGFGGPISPRWLCFGKNAVDAAGPADTSPLAAVWVEDRLAGIEPASSNGAICRPAPRRCSSRGAADG
jgi:hypothetical protein